MLLAIRITSSQIWLKYLPVSWIGHQICPEKSGFEFFCAFKFGFSPNFHKIKKSFDLKVHSSVYCDIFAWSSSSPTIIIMVYPHVRVCIMPQATPMLWWDWDWLMRGTAIKGDILHILNSTEVDISAIYIIRDIAHERLYVFRSQQDRKK